MKDIPEQGEFFGLVFQTFRQPFRLRVNDVIPIDGRLGRVIRINDCAAVIIMHRRAREFVTRFDKRVRFQPSPVLFRISPNADTEILNRKTRKKPKSIERKT